MRRNQGYVAWVLLAALLLGVLAAWQYDGRRAMRRERETEAKAAQEARAAADAAAAERKVLEQRLRQAHQEEDALRASLKAVDAVVARWEDAVKVASTTGRISLPGPVAALQAVKRDAEQLTVPPCLDGAKAELLKSMDSTVEGFLVFMRNEYKAGDSLSSPYFSEAAQAMAAYRLARTECPR